MSIASLLRQKGVQQILRFLGRLIGFLIVYTAVNYVAITVFSILYKVFREVDFPFQYSLHVFAGEFMDKQLGRLEILEIILSKAVIPYMCIAWAVRIFLYKTNPIHFASCCVVTRKRELKLRYWIMLRKYSFLHDVRLKVRIVDQKSLYDEEGAREYFSWQQELDMARGVRQCTLNFYRSKSYINTNPVDSFEFFKMLWERKSRSENKKLIFSITGIDENGHVFCNSKAYSLSNIFLDARFARIRFKDCKSYSERKEYYKYQNFNKIVLRDKADFKSLSSQMAETPSAECITQNVENQEDKVAVKFINNCFASYYNCTKISIKIKNMLHNKLGIDFS